MLWVRVSMFKQHKRQVWEIKSQQE